MRDSQPSSSAHSVSQPWRRTDFAKKLNKFLKTAEEHILKEANPGGHYTAIWPRDASYILKDQFISGANIQAILQQILIIWSYQITENTKEKIVYGRGSPEMGFRSLLLQTKMSEDLKEHFLQQYTGRKVSLRYMHKIQILILQL